MKSVNREADEPRSEYGGLSSRQHQYLSDELNLARLYFETGDTEEALKLVQEISERGSDDLKSGAQALKDEYATE